MTRLPAHYPRKTVRIAIEHLLRHPIAIANRAAHDKIILLQCGKSCRVMMNHAYFELLLEKAGQIDDERSGRRWPSRFVKRQFRSRRRSIPN